MLVKERMSKRGIVCAPEVSVPEALKLMQREHIRRLPIIDKSGKLVGIVSDKDLLHASPSPATSLSVWEVTYLLGRITVRETSQATGTEESAKSASAARESARVHSARDPSTRRRSSIQAAAGNASSAKPR